MSDFAALMRRLTDRLAEQDAEIEGLKRRLNNMIREGVCTDVDHEKGKAKVKSGGIDSPPIAWAQRSGDQQEYDPPTKGERVIQLSPTGDPGQGIIIPGGYSDQFPQPYNKGASWYRKVGDATLLMDKEQVILKFDEASVRIAADGITIGIGSSSFKIGADGIDLAASKFNARKA